MRTFSSYGPINTNLHYYTPRTELVEEVTAKLRGTVNTDGSESSDGHYITVWAPRQTGKTWLMQQVTSRLRAETAFDIAILTMQGAKDETADEVILQIFVRGLQYWLDYELPAVTNWSELDLLFSSNVLQRPLILIVDEFDALEEYFIQRFANVFRTIHTARSNQSHQTDNPAEYLLHGIALIGVRSVLGIENTSGSPFNVQQSVHIPELTFEETHGIFQWYQDESGQQIEPAVINRIFTEFRGQPGLTCWFGELLTEKYNEDNESITLRDFDIAYSAALNALPNNNIINIISKANEEKYKPLVLEMFKTEQKLSFHYDNPATNFLYMNGVVDQEVVDGTERYLRFPNPFVQRRLFNYFSVELFYTLGRLHEPLAVLDDTIDDSKINIVNLMRLYEQYLAENHQRLFQNVPRRAADNRVYEAVYHFNLYMYLTQFLRSYDGEVVPEFPTGNGQIDLVIHYADKVYGLEVKSFANRKEYQKAIVQAARYAKKLKVTEIWLVLFIEVIDDKNRQVLEQSAIDKETGITVHPVFVTTNS